MNEVHICRSRAILKTIQSGACPDCKRWSRFVVIAYEWYGPSSTCLRCGRRWEDGEWMSLPSMRGARRQSIQRAKRAYLETEVVPSEDGNWWND